MAEQQVANLVMLQAMTLEERLACILSTKGGATTLPSEVDIKEIHAFNGMSGYNYWIGDTLVGQLYMATLQSGTYVIYKKTYINETLEEIYDYYDQVGNFFYQSKTMDGQCVSYTSIAMDTTSPFINHIYNVLHIEYQGTTFNYGNTQRIKYLEDMLNNFMSSTEFTLSVNEGLKDKALKNIQNEMLQVERDPVLKWGERQTIYSNLKDIRSKILSTKRRVHNFHYMLYDFMVRVSDLKTKAKIFKERPLNNTIGLLYKNTFGNLFWFAHTVRSNLGYSVALAIYGPFTFYFITQPMNPHAMWAVGKVRNAYIQVTKSLESTPTPGDKLLEVAENKEEDGDQDSVSTKQAATQKSNTRQHDWQERMSRFKAMQIAYEESMVFAERIGRIEQFETQFNFPLTAEAAWMEMELYLNDLEVTLTKKKTLDKRFIKFIENEKTRTLELQVYIWKKMAQFFLDHPYIVVDQDNEQTERNYYVGRQFVFFNKMTEKLSKHGITESPLTHGKINTLANNFINVRIEGNTVLDTLAKNSKLFRQEDLFNSDELRDYMKRQWEVIFMQQNKKQEAASFALQAYTWSIRNAMWLLQTIYSAKRSELGAIAYKYNLENVGTASIKANPTMNQYLENMFHNLAMEYTSIKKEMTRNLKNDKEFALREDMINNIKQYLVERDKLFNSSVYAKTNTASTQI